MSEYVFTNNPKGQLNAAIGTGDTSLTLQSGEGSEFPSISGDQIFDLFVWETGKSEWMTCTARSSDTFTVTRGASPQSFSSGAYVELRLSADALNQFFQKGTNRTVTSSPDGSLAANYFGEEVYDSVAGIWYKHCTGTTWKAMNS